MILKNLIYVAKFFEMSLTSQIVLIQMPLQYNPLGDIYSYHKISVI